MKKDIKFVVFDSNYIPKVSQWFVSLEGEGQNIGETSLYIRLAGCYSAACEFCDTKFSWFNNSKFPLLYDPDFIKKIAGEIGDRIVNRVTVTGGEPLHYLNHFSKLTEELLMNQNINSKLKLEMIGFESNGNLLSKEKNVLLLLKEFNAIKRKGVIPTLTISPKLEGKSCYDNQISDEEVEEMYKSAYKNIYNILYINQEINFKFIYGISDKENKMVEDNIKTLFEIGFKPKNIFLMPFTPPDPTGRDKDLWEKSKDKAAEKALALGIRYSPRIHIDRRLD